MALQGPEELGEQLEEPEDLDDQDASSISPAEEITLPSGLGGDDEPEEALLLPWDRFSAWLHCICVVGFDLELGQAVEKTSICYLSFPDSNSGCLGDTQFCFRFRQGSNRKQSLSCFLENTDRDAPPCLKRELGHYYGYVYFRQVRDKSLKRGYFQKSLVLVSKLPYVTFFHSLLKIMAPEYFEKQEPCLEAACNDIDRWPTPHPGRILTLPIMGMVIKIRIPTCYDKPGTSQLVQSAQSVSQVSIVLPTIHEVDLFRHSGIYRHATLEELHYLTNFRGLQIDGLMLSPVSTALKTSSKVEAVLCLHLVSSDGIAGIRTKTSTSETKCFHPVFFHIQMLWELVLLGEALVVMAPSPAESSDTVLALVSCISPLRYCSDFRPYFTIHDSEFKEYTTRTQAPPSVILGVTNPFFAKTLQHWPHIIRIGDMKQAGEMAKQMKVKKLKNLKTLDSKPGVYTAYKPYLNKDEEIIKQLQKGVQQKRPSAAQNAILRRYFLELTQSFIIPLERYVASLMPLQKSICPWKSPPQLHPFIQQDFMKTLEKAGPQLTSRLKGDWIGLYRNFLKSPNFDGWFRTRRREMIHKLEALHLEALCEEDLQQRVQKHSEVETVDLVLKLKDKLSQAEKEHLPVRPGTLAKLREHIEAVILSLPEDLQGILHKPSTP
ncbi:Protein DENND6A DENN domain-containing protein 6A [Takifugu flavidus]|uniref:Protein DENND6A DENN domain-containing protein 6A n=1 Tax=Takifugu flavidus TaxID=433684 RepID=A0A5C6N8T9_9TELE|nr:Protein DENND6A DENN domain-containing protein 6A [Takifugu flavidus]